MSKSTMQLAESKPRFKVGSRAFFEGLEGFFPSDLDEVEFEENPRLYKNFMQFRAKDGSRCLFKWRLMSADEFVDYTLQSKLPMEVGKFLVPEVAEFLGITIDHLKRLKPVIERLDSKHAYERVIYDAYITHNGFWLNEAERNLAYQEYINSRRDRHE